MGRIENETGDVGIGGWANNMKDTQKKEGGKDIKKHKDEKTKWVKVGH